jgi:hypothetical protein
MSYLFQDIIVNAGPAAEQGQSQDRESKSEAQKDRMSLHDGKRSSALNC